MRPWQPIFCRMTLSPRSEQQLGSTQLHRFQLLQLRMWRSSPAQQPKRVLVRLVSTYDITPLQSTVNLQLNKRKELHEWRSNNPGAKTGKHQKYNIKGGHNNKKSISATITREVKKAFTAQTKSSCGQHNNEPDDQATTDTE